MTWARGQCEFMTIHKVCFKIVREGSVEKCILFMSVFRELKNIL